MKGVTSLLCVGNSCWADEDRVKKKYDEEEEPELKTEDKAADVSFV